MRTQVLYNTTLEQAKDLAPWAAIVAKGGGGYIAFESVEDYEAWRKTI